MVEFGKSLHLTLVKQVYFTQKVVLLVKTEVTQRMSTGELLLQQTYFYKYKCPCFLFPLQTRSLTLVLISCSYPGARCALCLCSIQ
jgi:hypothetical protein